MQSAPLWLMKATLPGRAIGVGKGRIQAEDRVHHAQAVGTDDAHPAADGLHDLGFQFLAVLAGFLESGGDDDAGGNAEFDALAQQVGNAIGRSADDDEVRNFRQRLACEA